MIPALNINFYTPKPKSVNNVQSKNKAADVSFGAHPDYYKLQEMYYGGVLTSNYFRRGSNYGKPSANFADVVSTLSKLYKEKPKQKALIVGVGKCQEPFSMLAVIKDLNRDRKLKDVIDLSCVDMQSKIPRRKSFLYSFYDTPVYKPKYAPDSFVWNGSPFICNDYRYRVKDEILGFLRKTFSDKQKTQWNTRIQDVIQNFETDSFDFVSMNNVLVYISDRSEKAHVVENLERIVKPGGIIITDTCVDTLQNCKKLFDGIWQKTTDSVS